MKTSLVALTLLAITAVAVNGSGQDVDEKIRKIRYVERMERIARLNGLGDIHLAAAILPTPDDHEALFARLESEIRLKLRQNGVSVLPPGPHGAEVPTLVCIGGWQQRGGRMYQSVDVKLQEHARLVRNGHLVLHESWTSSLMRGPLVIDSTQPASEAVSDVRAEILVGVDDFCNEFLAANPPKKP